MRRKYSHVEDAGITPTRRKSTNEELEQEKQKLLKLIWSEHDKEVMQMTAHKLNKVIRYIDRLTEKK